LPLPGAAAGGARSRHCPHSGHRLPRDRLRRLGPGRLHAFEPRRPTVAAGGQHRARHDRPLAGADGGARGGHVIRGSGAGGHGVGFAQDPARSRAGAQWRRRRRERCAMTLWQDARALNLVAGAMTMVAFASLIVAGLWWLANRPMFELESIEIGPVPGRALEHVSIPSLRASHLNRFTGNFFTVDLDRVRQAFEDAPWVRRAQVRRVWPNRLFVGIEEHRPLAQWGDGRFVNTFGEPFRVNPEEVDDRAALL